MQVVFCCPGTTFSHRWVACFLELWTYCLNSGIQPLLSQAQSNNVYYARNKCLGGDVMAGKGQKPFRGSLDYSYICWLDSDSIFTTAQFQRLLNHSVEVVGALQPFEGGGGFTCGWLDEGFFRQKGYMPYLTPEGLKKSELNQAGLLEVDYSGFGMLLVKRGVYEAIEYPWHRPQWFNFEINGQVVQDFSMEDVGACMEFRKAGFRIFVDPAVRIGHEKAAVFG